MKTSELIGRALDWAVAQCEISRPYSPERGMLVHRIGYGLPIPPYSTDRRLGRPIIKREGIHWISNGRQDRAGTNFRWVATKNFSDPLSFWYGPTALVASLRCYAAGVLGDDVEVPEEMT